jgi:peptidoglycan lytic transglycosylase
MLVNIAPRIIKASTPSHRPSSLTRWIALLLGFCSFTTSVSHADTSTALISPLPSLVQQQRQNYQTAQQALKRGHFKTYRKYRERLHGYPLTPYLDYRELRRRLYRLPYQDVDDFLDHNDKTYLGDRLLKAWLDTLAKKRHWHDYQSYYQQRLNRVTLQCYWLQARISTGDESAYAEIASLWNVGESRPDECSPVFKSWISHGHLTPEMMWERHSKAIKNRKRSLAQYIGKLMPKAMSKQAALYREIDLYPQRLNQRKRFAEQSPQMQEIILHGIQRYARKDPVAALYEWNRYDAQQLFADQPRRETLEYLAGRLTRKGKIRAAERLIGQTSQVSNNDMTEAIIRDALRQQDWQRAYQWITRLPSAEQQSPRWMYWRARAMDQLQLDDPAYPTPQQIYTGLSMDRGFYSFLSADIVGRDYALRDQPVKPPQELVIAIANRPEARRAKELLAVKELNYARREWRYMTQHLDSIGHLAAAKLAQQWGWHRKTIQAMAAARSWDDLKLRFPLAYNDHIHKAADKLSLTQPLLFAIARQESAFAADAKSPAGAMGLMQLMPGTARYTARKAGVRYRSRDLLKPEKNIALGSFYINTLLNQFDDNRILAAAAYNAGPHRVKAWLSDKEDQAVPYDIWIETIPFKETRGYVQKILAYSVIYDYRLGNKTHFVSPKEAGRKL